MRRYTGGYYNDDIYFNNPSDYAVNLHDPTIRSLLSNCSINIICGQGPWEHVEWSTDIAARLGAAGIRHNLDLWGHDVSHDWPWWKKELDYLHRPHVLVRPLLGGQKLRPLI